MRYGRIIEGSNPFRDAKLVLDKFEKVCIIGVVMKPSSDLRFCRCACCRAGLHRGSGNKSVVKRARRHARRLVKELLKRGIEDVPERFTVTYTD